MASKTTTPKYALLANTLKDQIDNGVWGENTVIPTERDISSNYQVSRSTVRQAIQLMTEEGYLRSEQGSGTFVMPSSSRDSYRTLHSFSDDLSSKGQAANQKILELQVIEPSEFIRGKLALSTPGVKVQKIKRLRFAGTTPIGIQTAYIALNGNEAISESELETHKSLYKAIQSKWGFFPVEALESLSARLPSPVESQLLEIPAMEAVLVCNRVTLSSKFTPMEYVEMIYSSSRYDYKVRINRKSFQT